MRRHNWCSTAMCPASSEDGWPLTHAAIELDIAAMLSS
jgi:hypothetical protein